MEELNELKELNIEGMIAGVNKEVKQLLDDGNGILNANDGLKADDGKVNDTEPEGGY